MTPAWLRRCVPADIRKRSYDALEFLEPHEVDYDWRLCRVSVEKLPVRRAGKFWYESARDTQRRFADIRAWMHRRGGPAKALASRPILATLQSRGLKVIDGYHRISVVADLGLEEIPVLIGTPRRRTP